MMWSFILVDWRRFGGACSNLQTAAEGDWLCWRQEADRSPTMPGRYVSRCTRISRPSANHLNKYKIYFNILCDGWHGCSLINCHRPYSLHFFPSHWKVVKITTRPCIYDFCKDSICIDTCTVPAANQDPVATIMGPGFASVGGVPGGTNTLLEVHERLARERARGAEGKTGDELDSSFRLMLLVNNLDLKMLHSSVKQMGKWVN